MDRDGERAFCRRYLRWMDPERAARESGAEDGCALLQKKSVKKKLQRMRECAADVGHEDVIRRLCELAFGRANDAVKLALGEELSQEEIERLDLSAVSEFKRGSNGSVEIKLIDRVRALELLHDLLGTADDGAAAEFFRAMGEEQEDDEWED